MRALLALVLLAAAVAGAVFFAENPGRVEIVWRGWQIGTSVGVLIGAVALVAIVVAALVLLAAGLRRTPDVLRRHRAARRQRAGETALTRGLVALAAADAPGARRYADRAQSLLGPTPVTLLLAAEAAQRQGDTVAAQRAYAALLENPETEFLGLRGQIAQALRAGDDGAARHVAERARRLRPDARWLAENLLVLQARAGEWQAALDTLTGAAKRRVLPAESVGHQRGVVLYELSRAAERRGEVRQAAGLAAKAQALAPDLASLASHNARLLIGLGRRRAAGRAIERAWRSAPHPKLAHLYLELHPEEGPLARAASLQRLAAQNPDAAESHLAIAEAALAAQLWGEARRHLTLAVSASPGGPSRRLCLLMARLEEKESSSPEAARGWLDRAIGAPPDPCYVCSRCAAESVGWQSLCASCGGFDTLVWQVPANGRRAIGATATASGALLMPPAAEIPAPPLASPSRLAATEQSDK